MKDLSNSYSYFITQVTYSWNSVSFCEVAKRWYLDHTTIRYSFLTNLISRSTKHIPTLIFPSMKMSERTRVLNCSCLSFHCNVRLWPDTVKRVCTKKTKIVTSVMTIKGYTIYNLKRKQNSIGLIALSFWIIKGIFKSYVIMKTFRYLPTTTRFRAKHFIP